MSFRSSELQRSTLTVSSCSEKLVQRHTSNLVAGAYGVQWYVSKTIALYVKSFSCIENFLAFRHGFRHFSKGKSSVSKW